ncbi:hypothetical protein [Hyphomicrobium sp.]|uniref:hypothetical protein n=1 Tax=Hyphomicrobium sp. TaxID=82 RepID=UPI002D76C246|nr:hypothetical protein [Hyphomicrobium sp.]HET6390637.1 hypothetical protein [Hyphomicrobium sp.]
MGGFIARAVIAAGLGLAIASSCPEVRAGEATQSCTKEDFEAVVEAASGSLRDLNIQNRPIFQEKLRELKAKRHWTNDEFIVQARPFVKDEKMDVYDKTASELLAAIASMGQEGASAASPNCDQLVGLRQRMKLLVDTQSAKWFYMFEKLDAELAK